MSTLYYESSLVHHGIKGQKWGVRRFQNPDGTLTKAGKNRQFRIERSAERGKKIAEDPYRHVEKDVMKIAGKNIKSEASKAALNVAGSVMTDLSADLAAKGMTIAVGQAAVDVAPLLSGALAMSIESIPIAAASITAGQIIYSAYKGISLLRDANDYNNYKKSAMKE